MDRCAIKYCRTSTRGGSLCRYHERLRSKADSCLLCLVEEHDLDTTGPSGHSHACDEWRKAVAQ